MSNVDLRHVSKRFGALTAIDDMNLTVEKGSFTALLGPSGCGKSTLLRMIAGLENVSDGQVLIGGEDVTDVAPAERGIAMVFQSYALYPHMTVRQNIAFSLRVARHSKAVQDAQAEEIAALLRLSELLDRRPAELSGGQRQRVAIGRALVRKPKVFLFDEPLSNLDAMLRIQMRLELARLHKDLAATMIYVTHDQVEAMTLADRIVVLDRGRVAQVGTPSDLYHRPANRFVAAFVGAPPMNIFAVDLELGPAGHTVARMPGGASIDLPCGATGAGHQLGARPEHMSLCDSGSGHFSGRVALVERLGNSSVVYVETEAGQLVSELRGETRFQTGDITGLRLDPDHLHLFGPDGAAIR